MCGTPFSKGVTLVEAPLDAAGAAVVVVAVVVVVVATVVVEMSIVVVVVVAVLFVGREFSEMETTSGLLAFFATPAASTARRKK